MTRCIGVGLTIQPMVGINHRRKGGKSAGGVGGGRSGRLGTRSSSLKGVEVTAEAEGGASEP